MALVTPMNHNKDVDLEALRRLVEFHIDAGTNAIVAVGTTGESATLDVEEHLVVIDQVVRVADKRLPVIAGTGANSTREAIHLTRQAADIGADAALLVVPYYNKPGQEGLYQHFRTVAEAVDIPQFLYNVPGRTVADMHNETIARLAKIDNIVGCKDATGDLERGKRLIDLCGDQITILSGDDATALDYMRLGARGDISVTANVAPAKMKAMCDAALARDWQLAEQLDASLSALHSDLFLESNPIPVKYAVAKMGFGENVLRLPLTPLNDDEKCETVDLAMAAAE